MTAPVLLIFSLVFLVFALVSRRIQGTVFTPPILFALAGLALGLTVLPLQADHSTESALHFLAELTLVLVLAADASRISLKSLLRFHSIPIRLLVIALPLIILAGTAAGLAVLPEMMWMQAALLAAILAPTDAALGASVLSNDKVPLRIRQGLNVESGLNDGIALPAVLFFACFLNLSHQTGEENWIAFLALQLTLGPLVGIAVGWAGGQLIGLAATRGWITPTFQGVAAMALAVTAFAAAEVIGGNGFIAAFLAGLTYGNLKVMYSHFMHEFTETESELLSQLTFFLFGILLLPEALAHLSWEVVVYAFLSLTVVRMIPVAIAMLGMKLHLPTVGFLGWFGPRGLASLLFALLVLEDLSVADAGLIQSVVAVTVFMSIMLHGLTAAPLSARYAKWASAHTTPACGENVPVDETMIHQRINEEGAAYSPSAER